MAGFLTHTHTHTHTQGDITGDTEMMRSWWKRFSVAANNQNHQVIPEAMMARRKNVRHSLKGFGGSMVLSIL
jgi:hypothetical protein